MRKYKFRVLKKHDHQCCETHVLLEFVCAARTDLDAFKAYCRDERVQDLSQDDAALLTISSEAISPDEAISE